MIRLTTPEAFERLITYLEAHNNVVWPEIGGAEQSFRDWWIEKTKAEMAADTVFFEPRWEYNPRMKVVECTLTTMLSSAIPSDEEYLAEEEENSKCD